MKNIDYIKNRELIFSIIPNDINQIIISYCSKCYVCQESELNLCHECFECNIIICDKCFYKCSDCNKIMCDQCCCQCTNCDEIICNECRFECNKCKEKKFEIDTSLFFCIDCGFHYCKNCKKIKA